LVCLLLAHPGATAQRFAPRAPLTPPPIIRQIPIVPGPVHL
jgi:hypothetical protein